MLTFFSGLIEFFFLREINCLFTFSGDPEESLEKTLRKLIFEEKSVNAEWAVLKCHIQINLGNCTKLDYIYYEFKTSFEYICSISVKKNVVFL